MKAQLSGGIQPVLQGGRRDRRVSAASETLIQQDFSTVQRIDHPQKEGR